MLGFIDGMRILKAWDQKGGRFVTSISADGNIVAVGAPYHIGIGHVKVYVWNEVTNAWNQLGMTLDGDPSDENFGYSIDLNESGDILAIGSKGSCLVGQNAGHTRIYDGMK